MTILSNTKYSLSSRTLRHVNRIGALPEHGVGTIVPTAVNAGASTWNTYLNAAPKPRRITSLPNRSVAAGRAGCRPGYHSFPAQPCWSAERPLVSTRKSDVADYMSVAGADGCSSTWMSLTAGSRRNRPNLVRKPPLQRGRRTMPNNPRGVHASETRYDQDGFPIRTGSVAEIRPLIDADWPPLDGRVLDGWVAVGTIAKADLADLTAVISAADIIVLSRDFLTRRADSAGHGNGGVRRAGGSSRSSGRADPRHGRRSDSPIRSQCKSKPKKAPRPIVGRSARR